MRRHRPILRSCGSLARRVNFDKVLPELKPFGGKVLKTSLTNAQEERLKKALEDMAAGKPA